MKKCYLTGLSSTVYEVCTDKDLRQFPRGFSGFVKLTKLPAFINIGYYSEQTTEIILEFMAAKTAERTAERSAEKNSAETKAAENAKIAAGRQRDLDAAISSITKAYGDGSIMRLGDARALKRIEVIPTGALALDLALGVGGVPRGRVV